MKLSWKRLCPLALAAAALAAWWAWWPSDEKRIHRLLTNLAREASVPDQRGALSDLAAANRMADSFAPEFQINVSVSGAPEVAISDRAELVQTLLAVRKRREGIKVELLDPRTLALEPAAAVVDATILARAAEESEPFVAEVRFTLVKLEARWRVSKVENARAFE